MKSKLLIGIALTTSLLASAPVIAADYIIDKKGQHAFVNFKASHLGYSYIIGRFNDFDGGFSYDAANPEDAKANITIQTMSLDTNHAERDKHLRSADFFNASKYPLITFDSKGFKDGKLNGDLSLNGVTKEIVLDVNHIGEGKDPWGGYRSGFEGNGIVQAADFGLPDWVGNVEITVNVEGVRQ